MAELLKDILGMKDIKVVAVAHNTDGTKAILYYKKSEFSKN